MYTYDVDLGSVALVAEGEDGKLENVGELMVDAGLATESVCLKDLPKDHMPDMLRWKIDEFIKTLELRKRY